MRRGPIWAVAALALLAACGDGDDDGATAAPIVVEGASESAAAGDGATSDVEAASSTDEELALEFADCMRAEGIDYVDPDVDADGSVDLLSGFANLTPGEDDEAAQAAFDVCGDLLEGSSLLPDAAGAEANEEVLLEFARCLRAEGLDVDDPDVNALGGGTVTPQSLFGPNFDPFDPANEPVLEVCAPIMADAGLGPGAG